MGERQAGKKEGAITETLKGELNTAKAGHNLREHSPATHQPRTTPREVSSTFKSFVLTKQLPLATVPWRDLPHLLYKEAVK